MIIKLIWSCCFYLQFCFLLPRKSISFNLLANNDINIVYFQIELFKSILLLYDLVCWSWIWSFNTRHDRFRRERLFLLFLIILSLTYFIFNLYIFIITTKLFIQLFIYLSTFILLLNLYLSFLLPFSPFHFQTLLNCSYPNFLLYYSYFHNLLVLIFSLYIFCFFLTHFIWSIFSLSFPA